jgi:hypothetical protein
MTFTMHRLPPLGDDLSFREVRRSRVCQLCNDAKNAGALMCHPCRANPPPLATVELYHAEYALRQKRAASKPAVN